MKGEKKIISHLNNILCNELTAINQYFLHAKILSDWGLDELAKKEGIITGVSGGSTFAIAVEVAKKATKGSNILCMLPDTAERYMSSVLFDSIEPEMNEEEQKLYNSV